MRADHLARVDAALRREGAQQRLVAGEVIEHAGEKPRLARGRADRIGSNSGYRQEAAEPFGVGGDETERRDRQRLGSFPLRLALRRAPIPHLQSPRWLAAASSATECRISPIVR